MAFEALTAADGSYLIEHYQFAYASSSRDLLRTPDKFSSGTIVFASPDFELSSPPPSEESQQQLAQASTQPPNSIFHGERSLDVRGLNWVPLRASIVEASRIEELLDSDPRYGPVTTYMHAEAQETLLKQLAPPRVLHLATHGYYLSDQPREHPEEPFHLRGSEGGSTTTIADLTRLGNLENPLLRSGHCAGRRESVGRSDTINRRRVGHG